MDIDTVQRYLDDANQENAYGTQRGTVLVWASILDDVLRHLLEAHVDASQNALKDLLGSRGPLGSFSSRIRMAHALGLIAKDEAILLHVVRQIRNDFAHQVGVSLSDAQLAQRCIDFGNSLTGETGVGDPRLKFSAGCATLLMILFHRLQKTNRVTPIDDERSLPERAFS